MAGGPLTQINRDAGTGCIDLGPSWNDAPTRLTFVNTQLRPPVHSPIRCASRCPVRRRHATMELAMRSKEPASRAPRKPPEGAKRSREKPSRRTKPRAAEASIASSPGQDTDQPAEQISFSPEQWQEMVATAAYYRAERRGFERGSPVDDWIEAESELKRAHGIE